jgi:geranylgeranyl pyrophosphate synthase/uncharacterized protein with NAD-binding domain and iron-sulfur cluster
VPEAVVLGGGIAGMTAAHELAERGFDVVVLERRAAPGGKARSIYGAPRLFGPGPERYHESTVPWAPGEHGFRFFPGFYRHVIDSMRRIPTESGGSVADSLVATTRVGITQYGRPMLELPARFPRTASDAVTALQLLLQAFGPVTGLTPEDIAFFGGRIWQILTSSPERRLAEYEGVSWWTFLDAGARSDAYRKFLVEGQTRSLVAAQARRASTRTVGDMFVQLALRVFDPTAVALDRVLDGPTTDVWLEPWRRRLGALGAEIRTGTEVRHIRCDGGRVTGVVVEHPGGSGVVEGDYFICAVPVECAATLMNPQLVAADSSLASLALLADNTEWMNGLQFYLRRDVPMLHGHVIHMDSEWALTSVSQVQFWSPEWYDRYVGDVEFDGILSVDVSDWTAPGPGGRPALECTPGEVAAEVWAQVKRSVNGGPGGVVLDDDDLVGWFLDPDITADPGRAGRLQNLEPLLVNYVDTWRLRPEAVTRIGNFFLAADYVRTHTDLATMEAANEAARRAVNGVLDAAGHDGPRCAVWPLEEPPVFAPWRDYDAARFRVGLPWDRTLLEVAAAGLTVAEPVLAGVPEIIGRIEPYTAAVAELDMAMGRLDRAVPALRPEQTIDPLVDAGPAGFAERLGWYREQALEALLAEIPAGGPDRHLYDLVRDFVTQPSKGVRPALCLATCRAYGGSTEAALPSAAGLELLHNAFLVHDDIEDASLSRRGRPTMHQRVGVPLAINAGDTMNALSMRLFRRNLARLGPVVALRIVDEVDHLLVQSLEGQALELGWIRDNDCGVTSDDYLRMVLKKTAWYSFIHPMRIGALAAGCQPDRLDRFHRFGFLLGAAFQIQDDVLNLTGTASRYGKEIGGDLWEGKRTLLLVHAIAHGTGSDRARLEEFLSHAGRRPLDRQVAAVRKVLDATGSVDWARRAAAALSRAAAEELPAAYAGARPGPDVDFVRSLTTYVVDRDV